MASNIIVLLFCLTQLAVLSVATASGGDFSVSLDLIHRDSPLSPLYNPLHTRFDRLYNAYSRSTSRINRFITTAAAATTTTTTSKPNDVVQSDIAPSGGEYFMRISIGTPPVPLLGIADTGSDLTWVQCEPCEECYEQSSPLFDPRKSSTYKNVPCGSNSCNELDSSARLCDDVVQQEQKRENRECKYSYSYGDRSFTKGNVALEKFTIGNSNNQSPVNNSFPNRLVFGCGHENGGTFNYAGSGIVGLGGGPLSLIKQLGKSINGKFSYCLASPAAESTSSSSSTITFGSTTTTTTSSEELWNYTKNGELTVSTPLVEKTPSTYYYITLEAVSVRNTRLSYGGGGGGYGGSSGKEKWKGGNIIIDSGTTLTILESEFYNGLESVVEESVEAKRVSDPKGIFSPCFETGGGGEDNIDLPVITFHFSGGADLKLKPLNTFAQVEENMVCFTIVPSNDVAIFGNLSQMDFLVSYDLEEKTVSFKPTDCTK